MFKAIRKYQEGKQTRQTVKEYESVEKAVAYARRYAKGDRFLTCEVFDADDEIVFRLETGGEEKCFPALNKASEGQAVKDVKAETKAASESANEIADAENAAFVQTVLDMTEEESGKGDFATELVFKMDDKERGKTCRFRSKQAAMTYALQVVRKAGKLLVKIDLRHGKEIRWMWQDGTWVYHKQREPCPAKMLVV